MDSTIKEFSLKYKKCIRVFKQTPPSWITALSYSPNGVELAAAGISITKIWNTQLGLGIPIKVNLVTKMFHAIGYDTKGEKLVIGNTEGFVTYDIKSKKIDKAYSPLREVYMHPLSNRGFYTGKTKDGVFYLESPAQGYFKEINTLKKELIRYYPRAVFSLYAIALSHNPPQRIIRCEGHTSKIQERWEESNDRIREFSAHRGELTGVVYSPDDTLILSCSFDGEVKIWDAKSEIEDDTPLHTIRNIPGLFIQGCDFRGAIWEPELTPEQENILRTYGAILTDQDKEDWDNMLNELYPEDE